jgi:hypothetical protein
MKEAVGSSETSVLKEPNGITSQETPFFIKNAVFWDVTTCGSYKKIDVSEECIASG